MSMSYQPVKMLSQLVYGYSPSSVTVHRWKTGDNARGIALHVVKIGGKLMTTESHLREFIEGSNGASPEREASQKPKSRSAKAKAKALEATNKWCEAAGI